MDQADWKLRVFYQYQIAKIARLARDRTHPAARKRLNFLLNEYINKLLAMPRPNERMQGVETKMLPTCPVSERRVARALKPASKSWLKQHAPKEISPRLVRKSGQIFDRSTVLRATLVERHSRHVMLVKVANKDTESVVSALIKQSQRLPSELYRSLTCRRRISATSKAS